MRLLVIITIILLSANNGICKQVVMNSAFPELGIKWTPLENRYMDKEEALFSLEISNKGNKILPAEGWKLYFNLVRIVKSKESEKELMIKHVNGDLFYLYPAKDFKGLKPGEQIKIELIVSGALVISSDAPQGFYLVSDDEKDILPVKDFELLPAPDPQKLVRFKGDEEITSAEIYSQNQILKDVPLANLTKIFPSPYFYKENPGTFTINNKTTIAYEAGFENEANILAEGLSKLLGKKLPVIKGKTSSNTTILFQKDTLSGEAYQLSVSSTGVLIKAGSAAGAFYATQSLITLIDPASYAIQNNKAISIPCVEVEDKPRFGFRALMLDVARNFHPKAQILKLLDLMALYKLNTLHLHLNDDEGWRLEIPALPELTETGGSRGHIFNGEKNNLPPSYGSGPYKDKLAGSGYFSTADFIEILRFANARHIKIIPEIETPGHARAAIKAMDARYYRLLKEGKKDEAEKYLLHDFDDYSVYRSVQKWDDNVMDVSKNSVYNFLETVTDGIISIYKDAGAPLTTIHFGGDEVPDGVWEKSPSYLKLKATNAAIKTTDDLWYYFFAKVDAMLKKRGLYLSGWEEIAMRKTRLDGKTKWIANPDFSNNNFHVNVWNNIYGNEDLAYRLANSGYRVILSFVTNFYLDMAYHKKFEEQSFYWGGFTELDKPFSFIPFDYLKNQKKDNYGRPLSQNVLLRAERLTDYGKENILGLQGLLWTETVKTPAQMEYLILPRLLALAERAWTKSPDWAEETDSLKTAQNYNNSLLAFFNLLGKRELKRLDEYAGGFEYRIPAPGVKKEGNLVYANNQLPGFTIRYTTDGSTPTIKSPVYKTPVKYQEGLVFRTFNDKGRGSRTSKID